MLRSAYGQLWSSRGGNRGCLNLGYPTYHTALRRQSYMLSSPPVPLLYRAEGGSTALRRCDNPYPRASRDFRTPDVIYMHTWSWLPLLNRSAKHTRPQPRKGPKTASVALLGLQALPAGTTSLLVGPPTFLLPAGTWYYLSLEGCWVAGRLRELKRMWERITTRP